MSGAEPASILLGYDAREWWLDRAVAWGAEWKRQAVGGAEVEKPLSIDRQVWPSLFEELEVAEPAYTGLFPGMWAGLDRLRSRLAGLPDLGGRRWALAAFKVLATRGTGIPEASWREWSADVQPARLGDDWQRMGYDVADRDGASALVTMRPSLDEPLARRGLRLAALVNRWHLLDAPPDAARLAAVADAAIPEHAPFCVYGVWVHRPTAPW